MKILSFKPGHDGSIALIEDSTLIFSWEAEKDSFPRHVEVGPSHFLEILSTLPEVPDVFALSGWVKGFYSDSAILEGGYFGWDTASILSSKFQCFGKRVKYYTSSHERSHIVGAYGMSPFKQGEPCYALVWEGNIGSFYEIDENVGITRLGQVMADPGNKYVFLYALADPDFPAVKSHTPLRLSDAGKLMALASFSDRATATDEENKLFEDIFQREAILRTTSKSEFSSYSIYNIGVEQQHFKNIAGKFSDALLRRFANFASKNMRKGYPLLIAGGCGLNCEWNSFWANCGLFSDVFIPPCPNDSGSAIGTAIDAQLFYTGNAKIKWVAYSGQEFQFDDLNSTEFRIYPASNAHVAELLEQGLILGWANGKCEIGPRALGNRSILAAPFSRATADRLNTIKGREKYRPIAPICLLDDAKDYFELKGESPYMLFFHKVKSDKLEAITHVDGSARAQTVTAEQNKRIYSLLQEFKKRTGYGVLCNTSLNFQGRGFINRLSDLAIYSLEHGLDGFVAGDQIYLRRAAP